MSYACGKQYCMCMACMLWCSNTKSVPLKVSNIDDTILVRTQYVPVCTGLYYYTFSVQVRTQYVLRTYRYILNTLFLYHGSRFQMVCQCIRYRVRFAFMHGTIQNITITYITSGIMNRRTGTGYLVRTFTYTVRTRYVLVQKMYNSTDQYILVRTEYVPEQCHVCWTPLGALIQCWSTTAYMPSTHSIVSHRHTT